MKIALIRPNLGDYRASDAMAPLGLGILAARSAGHQVKLFDERIESVPADLDADLAALTVETFTARRAYGIADRLRARGTPVVMGGYHPSLLPGEATEHADAIVVGDAEGVWEALLDDAAAGRLAARYTADHRRPLDDYRIDRSIFAGRRYAPVELVQYTRGCRFVCDFCSIHRFYDQGVRARPVAGLVAELASLPAKRLLFFVDDNLFNDRATLTRLLDAIEPLRRRWACQISIDVARDPLLLDRLAATGCRFVLIGFESLDANNLRQMGKPWNRVAGDYRSVVRALHERGIGIYGTFVFGYDHDTPETIRRSVDFALEAGLDIANFNPLTPTPGSALYDRLATEGRLLRPRWWLDPDFRYGDPIFVPARMSAEALGTGCFDAKRDFYRWTSIARRVLNPERGLNGFSTAMSAIANLISRREVYRKQGRVLGT